MADNEEDYPGGVPSLQRTNAINEVVNENPNQQLQPGQYLQNNQIMMSDEDQVGGLRRRKSRRRRRKTRRSRSRKSRRRKSRRRRH
jgi:hypothetical protein